ncbi:(2Fe-2S)-binding protein [Acidocella sp.]|jgi:nicotinate dehydrogenase subunit A|uniref:(2Fe-2S)-binding protein n=1 Tax=Acidocella sp. TaxID=50710 RepID=UPI002F42C2AF
MTTRLAINGQVYSVDDDPGTPLLYVLRDTLKLNGAKFGCGLGQCGACTVMQDGYAIVSCLMPIGVVAGSQIKTIEGLGSRAHPGVLQQAFIDEQAA